MHGMLTYTFTGNTPNVHIISLHELSQSHRSMPAQAWYDNIMATKSQQNTNIKP